MYWIKVILQKYIGWLFVQILKTLCASFSMQSCFSRSTEPWQCFHCGRQIVSSLNRTQIYMAASMEEVELNAKYIPVFYSYLWVHASFRILYEMIIGLKNKWNGIMSLEDYHCISGSLAIPICLVTHSNKSSTCTCFLHYIYRVMR